MSLDKKCRWTVCTLFLYFFNCFTGTVCVCEHLRPGDGAISAGAKQPTAGPQPTSTLSIQNKQVSWWLKSLGLLLSVYFFPSCSFAESCIFCRNGSQVWMKKSVRKKWKERGQRRKKSHLFLSSKGLYKVLTLSHDGSALYGCIIILVSLRILPPTAAF